MWPTLEVGSPYRFWLAGSGRLRFAYVVDIDADGKLSLAFPPRSSRGRWIPGEVARTNVKAVFLPAAA